MRTPESFCRRACPIKAKGHCDPEKCYIVPIDDLAVQKSLDKFPLELKVRMMQDNSMAFVRCHEYVWVTFKDADVYESGQKKIASVGLPSYVEFESESNRDMGYHG